MDAVDQILKRGALPGPESGCWTQWGDWTALAGLLIPGLSAKHGDTFAHMALNASKASTAWLPPAPFPPPPHRAAAGELMSSMKMINQER